jgi:hypothetical protein
MAAFLGQVGRSQVDRYARPGQAKANGVERISDPLTALGHRLVGQTDDREVMLAIGDAGLDLDRARLDPDKCKVVMRPYMIAPVGYATAG